MRMQVIDPKGELDLLRDQAESCRNMLYIMAKNEGESPVIDANIRHKRAQLAALEDKIRQMAGTAGK